MDARSFSQHGTTPRSDTGREGFAPDTTPLTPSELLRVSWLEFAKKEGWIPEATTTLDESHRLVHLLEAQFPKMRGTLSPRSVVNPRFGFGHSALFAEALGSRGEHLLPVYAAQIDEDDLRGAKTRPARMLESFSHPVGIVLDETPLGQGHFSVRALFTEDSFANARRHLHAVDLAFRDRRFQYTTRDGLISNVSVPSYLFQEALENLRHKLEIGELCPGHESARLVGLRGFSILDKSAEKAHLEVDLDILNATGEGRWRHDPYLATIEMKFLFNRFLGVPYSELSLRSLSPQV